MKVLFITAQWERFPGDPVIPWLKQLAILLNDRGINVSVFTASYRGLKSGVIDGIPVYRFRYMPKRFENLSHEEAVVEKLKKSKWYWLVAISFLVCGSISAFFYALRNRFDIIHVHWPFPLGVFGIIMMVVRGIPLVYSFYTVELVAMRNSLFRNIMRFLLIPVKAVVCISTYTRRLLLMGLKVSNSRVYVIPLGSGIRELKGFSPCDEEREGILFVGRLVERKGVRYLIEALRICVYELDRRYNLNIVGEGPERNKLEQQVREAMLEDFIHIHGKVSNRELENFYKKSKIFVLPAVYDVNGETEGLGVVLIEAISYNLPVIASNVGGIPDIVIHNKTGLLVPEKNIRVLAETIVRLYEDEGLRKKLIKEGQKHIKENFSWEVVLDKFTDVYMQGRGDGRYATSRLFGRK